jgi:hypothetical protein
LWRGWSKADVRAWLHPRIRRSVADLKQALVLAGPAASVDTQRYVNLVPEPEDILLVFAGGEEANMSSVIPSWGPKVGSTAVTKAVRPPP